MLDVITFKYFSMVSCSVMDCKSRSERKYEGITFHAFPIDPEIKRKWVSATGKKNWEPTKYSRLCSRHFESNLLVRKKTRTELFSNAVPTLYVIKEEVTNTDNLVSGLPNISNMELVMMPKNVAKEHQINDDVMGQPRTFTAPLGTLRSLIKKLRKQQRLSEKRLKMVRALRQKTKRLEKKVADLEQMLEELKAKALVNKEDHQQSTYIDDVISILIE